MGGAGFWGLKMVSGKLYEHEVDIPFRVSMASLAKTIKGHSRSCVVVKVDGAEYTLCALTPGKTEQQPLDFVFSSGEKISFQVAGDNDIDLTGNYIPEEAFYSESDEESDNGLFEKRGQKKNLTTYKDLIGKLAGEGIGSEEDPEYVDGDSKEESDSEVYGEKEEEESDDSEDADLMEEDSEQVTSPKSEDEKARKAQVPQKPSGDVPSKKMRFSEEFPPAHKTLKESPKSKMKTKSPKLASEESKKEKSVPKDETKGLDISTENNKIPETPEKGEANGGQITQTSDSKRRTLANGLILEDLVVVKGGSAIVGKGCIVSVRYSGRLAENGQEFDQNFKGKGKPLKFTVGKGEVIEGWEKGILGMRAGDQRKLIVPPELAYDKKGMPPKIPPNATLEFRIKVVKVQK